MLSCLGCYANEGMGELFKLLGSLDGVQDVPLGAGIAWVLCEVRLLKARAREDRQKNEADHARLFSVLGEVKTKLEILLDRSNRPDGDGGAG